MDCFPMESHQHTQSHAGCAQGGIPTPHLACVSAASCIQLQQGAGRMEALLSAFSPPSAPAAPLLTATAAEVQAKKASMPLSAHALAPVTKSPSMRARQRQVPDDGHQWLKYGHKTLVETSFSRAYYRCAMHNSGCRMKKTVDFPNDHSQDLRIVYSGSHNHGTSTSTLLSSRLTKEADSTSAAAVRDKATLVNRSITNADTPHFLAGDIREACGFAEQYPCPDAQPVVSHPQALGLHSQPGGSPSGFNSEPHARSPAPATGMPFQQRLSFSRLKVSKQALVFPGAAQKLKAGDYGVYPSISPVIPYFPPASAVAALSEAAASTSAESRPASCNAGIPSDPPAESKPPAFFATGQDQAPFNSSPGHAIPLDLFSRESGAQHARPLTGLSTTFPHPGARNPTFGSGKGIPVQALSSGKYSLVSHSFKRDSRGAMQPMVQQAMQHPCIIHQDEHASSTAWMPQKHHHAGGINQLEVQHGEGNTFLLGEHAQAVMCKEDLHSEVINFQERSTRLDKKQDVWSITGESQGSFHHYVKVVKSAELPEECSRKQSLDCCGPLDGPMLTCQNPATEPHAWRAPSIDSCATFIQKDGIDPCNACSEMPTGFIDLELRL